MDIAHHEGFVARRLRAESNLEVIEEIEEAESCNEVECREDDVPIDVLKVSQHFIEAVSVKEGSSLIELVEIPNDEQWKACDGVIEVCSCNEYCENDDDLHFLG